MRIRAAVVMNVMRLVADTVRRQTAIFRHASTTAQPLIADPETEPYKYQIQRLAIYNLSPETSATVDEKINGSWFFVINDGFRFLVFVINDDFRFLDFVIKHTNAAITTIGHLSWTGGPSAAEFTGKNYLQVLVPMLQKDSEPHKLRLQIVKSLSEICHGCKSNQELSRNVSAIDVIINFMSDNEDDQETRKWCLHLLFFLLVDNEPNQVQAINNHMLKECVRLGLEDSWEGWENNEAQELSIMLKLI